MSTPLGNVAPWALETGWVVLAIVTHATFLGLMPEVPKEAGIEDPLNTVAIAILDEDPIVAEPDEELLQPAEPEPVKPPPKRKTFKAPKEPPTAPEEPPAAAPEAPVTFDNVVLTNEGDEPSSWAMDPGSGESREGPIGRPNAVVTGKSRNGVVGGIIGGVGIGLVVDVGDLSKAPIPPSLKRKLEKLYPKKARQEGIEGEAVIRMQVAPDGLPSKIRIISEDPTGYELGRACVKTLQGERWKPPIDKDGKAVATRVTYRCGFEIRY